MAGPTYTPAELAAALRRLDSPGEWTSKLRKRYRKVGTLAATWARASLRSGAGGRDGSAARLAAAARVVRGASTATTASVSAGGSAVPGGLATIWGTKGPTGWAGGWYRGEISPTRRAGFAAVRNNPRWVGSSWTVATKGSGPRGINDALAEHMGDLNDEFLNAAMETIAEALPRGLGR